MARGTWHFRHRYVIYRLNGALADTVELAVGYGPGAAEEAAGASFPGNVSIFKDFQNESECHSECLAQLRAFQRLGDYRAETYTQPIGADATTPARALTAHEQGEQMLCSIDVIEPGWREAVNLANRDVVFGGVLDDMLPQDASGNPDS